MAREGDTPAYRLGHAAQMDLGNCCGKLSTQREERCGGGSIPSLSTTAPLQALSTMLKWGGPDMQKRPRMRGPLVLSHAAHFQSLRPLRQLATEARCRGPKPPNGNVWGSPSTKTQTGFDSL